MVDESLWRSRTMLCKPRLDNITSLFPLLPEGDVAELGVRDGGVCLMLKALLPDRRVWAFDTFAGMPDWADIGEKALTAGLYASIPDTEAVLISQGITCIKGTFGYDTAPLTAYNTRYSLVHLDADLHWSTLNGLAFFWPRLNHGGFIILDDYGRPECPGVMEAVMSYLAIEERHVHRHDVNTMQMILRKAP